MSSNSTNINPNKINVSKRYDFEALCAANPRLKDHLIPNMLDEISIDFANPKAVLELNAAILKKEYDINNWSVPIGYLCPPIPSRAAYIDLMANLLSELNLGKSPKGPSIKCFDIGVGANCVYPLIGHGQYGWQFVGSDVDPFSVNWATNLLKSNPKFKEAIELRLQPDNQAIFKGIIGPKEQFDFCICNPPFHASQAEAIATNQRKTKNLGLKNQGKKHLNFGGSSGELWCIGGEKAFIGNMINESIDFGQQFLWFSSLVSKSVNLKPLMNQLQKVEAKQVRQLDLVIGNKVSRVLAWTFQQPNQMKSWAKHNWQKKN